jgi:uroporphyrinogen decarboxylase
MQQIVDGLVRERDGRTVVPVTLFTKGGGQWLEEIAATGCNAVGLDWTTDIDAARGRVGDRVALQGNLDPCVLYADPDTIRERAREIIERFGNHPGHVFNLGHGIHQTVDPGHLGVLVDAVHEFGFEIRKTNP